MSARPLWFKCPRDAWWTIARALPRPFLREWAIADLRAYVHAYGEPPTYDDAASQWGWTRTRAGILIRDAAAWAD